MKDYEIIRPNGEGVKSTDTGKYPDKRLLIAVEALEHYADSATWGIHDPSEGWKDWYLQEDCHGVTHGNISR